MRVISGHLGWVRCIAVDPSNEWFATGSGDRTIKVQAPNESAGEGGGRLRPLSPSDVGVGPSPGTSVQCRRGQSVPGSPTCSQLGRTYRSSAGILSITW